MPMSQKHVEVEAHYLAVVARARRDAALGVYRSVDPDEDIYYRAYREACRELAREPSPPPPRQR